MSYMYITTIFSLRFSVSIPGPLVHPIIIIPESLSAKINFLHPGQKTAYTRAPDSIIFSRKFIYVHIYT